MKRILVYDRQFGYYELLKSLNKGYNFFLQGSNTDNNQYEGILFFLHDELEMLDFMKLFREDIPIMLGKKGGEPLKPVTAENKNIFLVDLGETKDVILKKLESFFTALSV